MKNIFIILIVLSVIVIWVGDSTAQTLNSNQLQTFMASDFYKGLINRSLTAIPPNVFQRCPNLASSGSKVTIRQPVSFGTDGFPNAGSWKQTFPVSGCGNDTILNFYFSAGSDEKINTVIGVPGSTVADISLQNDAQKYASTATSLVAKNCQSFNVKNTRFEGYGLTNPPTPDPGPNKPLRPWWETWTLVGCGRTFDVPIDFVPDKTGTQIIQPRGIIER
jgi:hypothetical protein